MEGGGWLLLFPLHVHPPPPQPSGLGRTEELEGIFFVDAEDDVRLEGVTRGAVVRAGDAVDNATGLCPIGPIGTWSAGI